MFALALVGLLGAAALVIDLGTIYLHRRVAQTAADSAALAAAKKLSLPPPDPSTTTAQEVARAACTYVSSNSIGSFTAIAVAEYVGIPASPGSPPPALGDVLAAGHSCPAPSASQCMKPRLSDCPVTASDVRTIPPAAAGVRIQSSQTFNTNFLGILGLPTFTTTADATALVGFTGGSNAPYLACGKAPAGSQAIPVDNSTGNSYSNPPGSAHANGTKWSTILGSNVNLLNGSGPYTVRTDLWSAATSGVVSTNIPGLDALDTGSNLPLGPAFVVNGNSVKDTCNMGNQWRGLSCVSQSSACPTPGQLILTLPPPSPTPYVLAQSANGNRSGASGQTIGPNGCRPSPNPPARCVSLVPLGIDAGPSTTMKVVAWGAFWLNPCPGQSGNNADTCGWFVANYSVSSGPLTTGWTYSAGPNTGQGGLFVVELVG